LEAFSNIFSIKLTDFLNSTVSTDVANFSFNNGNPLSDSITYKVQHYMRTSAGDRNKNNDTLLYQQKFSNYFSYDDGSAELAWGLQGTFGAETAVQFELVKPDTLRAVDIYFNPVSNMMSISNLLFGLRVWNDGGGTPGSLIYDDGNSMNRLPAFYPWGPNIFVRYYLNYPLLINPGKCYIGMKQDDQLTLNIGFDQNTNSQSKLFYNTNGFWANSSFKGSLLLRPIFGDSARAVGIKENSLKDKEYIIYPNPAKDFITISNSSKSKVTSIEIIDMAGKQLTILNPIQNNIFNVAFLTEGFYIVKLYTGNELLNTQKLIIGRHD
jgi:hypothetical protein